MRSSLRRVIFVCVGLAAVMAGGLAWLYRATQQAPEFYRQALAAPPPRQDEASEELIEQAATLANQAQREDRWEALFTAEQINGWLAVDLERNYADSLPPGVSEPRIRIAPDGATLACRWQDGRLSTVFSLTAEVYVAEPNVLGLRIENARAGKLPVPLDRVLEVVTQAAAELDWLIEWRQIDGDPTALITIPPPSGHDDAAIWIETLELRDDAVYLSGHTLPRDAEPPDAHRNEPASEGSPNGEGLYPAVVRERSEESSSRQR